MHFFEGGKTHPHLGTSSWHVNHGETRLSHRQAKMPRVQAKIPTQPPPPPLYQHHHLSTIVDWQIILRRKQILILFTVLSIKMINIRTSKPKYRLFLGKYRPFFDDFFQVGLYTDFLRKYGPLYKLCSWQKPVSSWENPVTSWYNQ